MFIIVRQQLYLFNCESLIGWKLPPSAPPHPTPHPTPNFWTLPYQYFFSPRIIFSNCVEMFYTLSHPKNNHDVSAYSRQRCLSSCVQLVCFLTRSKRNTGIDAWRMRHAACLRVSLGTHTLSDVTVVFGMRQSIVIRIPMHFDSSVRVEDNVTYLFLNQPNDKCKIPSYTVWRRVILNFGRIGSGRVGLVPVTCVSRCQRSQQFFSSIGRLQNFLPILSCFYKDHDKLPRCVY